MNHKDQKNPQKSAGRLFLGLITFCPKQGPNLELLLSFLAPFCESHSAGSCHQQHASARQEPHQCSNAGNAAEEDGLNLFPFAFHLLPAVASWKEQMASLEVCYSKDMSC